MIDRSPYRLLAIDLDGTLLSSHRELSAENQSAIWQARAQGLQVVIASGRPLFGIQRYLEKLALDGPVITYHGAYVMDTKDGQVIIDQPVARQDSLIALEIIREIGLYTGYYAGTEWYVERECDEMHWEFIAQKHPPILTDLTLATVPAAHKMIIADLVDHARLSQGYKTISRALPDLNTHYSGPHSFEITHPQASKGGALAYLALRMGIAPETIVAIGDNFNDLDMFSIAGTSIAMGNAPAEVKAQADWVVASNDDHGVAQAIQQLLAARD